MITSKELQKLEELVSPMIPGGWFADDGPGDGGPDAFREATRAARMEIADRVQPATGRSVAWGVTTGETTTVFTSLGVPVMTRLRIGERQVLDTLIAEIRACRACAGAASRQSRSRTPAWPRSVGSRPVR